MDENPRGEKARTKRPYSKPAVRRVHLKPEEAVLGGCKVSSTKGPAHGQCDKPTPCAAIAS